LNASMKRFLLITVKSGITAAVTAVGPVIHDPKDYNLTSARGWQHVLVLMGSAVIARELAVWIPKLLAWANSPTNGQA
jgi:hypothetical protein